MNLRKSAISKQGTSIPTCLIFQTVLYIDAIVSEKIDQIVLIQIDYISYTRVGFSRFITYK